ncbi:MAG: prepilin-type N-terminal cleavage/methylation domain-containing protein [Chthoniobacteraceae bacterium]|nr:prepilin-type N-terminal cleavage/methylation domain-containing protein [Chthoniobacteraceae bacterium]
MNASSPSRNGFTMVEMLVAVSVMSFMLLMMVKLTWQTQQICHLARNRIDNFTKARSMLDLLTGDLQRAVFRGDLPSFGTGGPAVTPAVTGSGLYYFTATSFANAFYTRMPGANNTATPVRDVSLVSYVLNTSNQGEDKIVLQRSDLDVPWTSSQNIAFQGDITPLLSNATAREVAPGVVGFRLVFRRADGSVVDQSLYTGYDPANPVVAVNVGLAVISRQSLALLSSDQIAQIQNAFANVAIGKQPGGTNGPNGIKAAWDQQILTPTFYASYPRVIGDDLKTFERWVACPAF